MWRCVRCAQVFDRAECLSRLQPGLFSNLLRLAVEPPAGRVVPLFIVQSPHRLLQPECDVKPVLVHFPSLGRDDTVVVLQRARPGDARYKHVVGVAWSVFSGTCAGDLREMRYLADTLYAANISSQTSVAVLRETVGRLKDRLFCRDCDISAAAATYAAAAAERVADVDGGAAAHKRGGGASHGAAASKKRRVVSDSDDSDDDSDDSDDDDDSLSDDAGGRGNGAAAPSNARADAGDAVAVGSSRRRVGVELELPYLTKFLLVAAFLASHNAASTDTRFFTRASSGRRGRGHGGGKKKAVVAPVAKPFALERLFAICSSLIAAHDAAFRPADVVSADMYSEVCVVGAWVGACVRAWVRGCVGACVRVLCAVYVATMLSVVSPLVVSHPGVVVGSLRSRDRLYLDACIVSVYVGAAQVATLVSLGLLHRESSQADMDNVRLRCRAGADTVCLIADTIGVQLSKFSEHPEMLTSTYA